MALNETDKVVTSNCLFGGLMAFDVVREWVSPFPCYRKDNYIVKYLQLTKPLFSICHFFPYKILNQYIEIYIYIYIEISILIIA